MSSTNSGPAQTQTQNMQPLAGTFNADGTPAAIVGPGGVVVTRPFDPSSVAITGGVIGGVPIRTYLGVVASRGVIPSGQVPSNKQVMSRTKHVAMENISSLQLVYANFIVNSSGESNSGSANQYAASIEYPVGTITQATFSGVAVGNVADGGTLLSDPVAVAIPRGAAFYVRTWQSNPSGIVYSTTCGLNSVAGSVPPSGEWVSYGVTVTDLTMSSSTLNNSNVQVSVRPAAIVGYTARPTFWLAGDSRLGSGVVFDSACNSYGGVGEIERSIGKSFGVINAGCSAEQLSSVAASGYAKRIPLAQYCSHVICEYGINDFSAGKSAATTLANLATFAAKFGGKPFFQTTVSPKSSSTDSWATTGGQTPDATANGPRVIFNDAVRAGLAAPITGCIEVADQMESARNSGLWKVTGSAFAFTPDGLHGNSAGNSLIEISTAFQGIGAG